MSEPKYDPINLFNTTYFSDIKTAPDWVKRTRFFSIYTSDDGERMLIPSFQLMAKPGTKESDNWFIKNSDGETIRVDSEWWQILDKNWPKISQVELNQAKIKIKKTIEKTWKNPTGDRSGYESDNIRCLDLFDHYNREIQIIMAEAQRWEQPIIDIFIDILENHEQNDAFTREIKSHCNYFFDKLMSPKEIRERAKPLETDLESFNKEVMFGTPLISPNTSFHLYQAVQKYMDFKLNAIYAIRRLWPIYFKLFQMRKEILYVSLTESRGRPKSKHIDTIITEYYDSLCTCNNDSERVELILSVCKERKKSCGKTTVKERIKKNFPKNG